VLTRNLRQLSAKNAAKQSTTHQFPLAKRKREDDGSDEQPTKKVDAGTNGGAQTAAATLKMHPCEDVDGVVGVVDWKRGLTNSRLFCALSSCCCTGN
jgi:hypothetical protein